MKITSNREYALCSTDVRDINNKEMRQMHELKNRIKDVLDSHKGDGEKKVSCSPLQSVKIIEVLND